MTPEYEFLSKYDLLSAEIYHDKRYYFLTVNEIARVRKMTVNEVKCYYSRAKYMLRHKNEAWLTGLSPRARKAILTKTKYKDFKRLFEDVMNEKIDLECLPSIGHKVACEIRRWCVSRR